jgi:hypothetical protein
MIYIAGSGRSGSTLLERCLTTAPGWTGVGELRYFWGLAIAGGGRCGCGEPLFGCDFWAEVSRSMRVPVSPDRARETVEMLSRIETRRLFAVDLLRERRVGWASAHEGQAPHRAHSRQAASREYERRLDALVRAVAQVSGCSGVVNSSKSPAHALVLKRAMNRPIHVVHLVRDSRAVAFAWSKFVLDPQRAAGGQMPRYTAKRAAKDWVIDNLYAECLRTIADTYQRIRYEDFARSPGTVLRSIFVRATGAPQEVRAEGGRVALGIDHTVHGNPMRFRVGEIDLQLDEGWKARMSRQDRRVVDAITAPLLSRYGYR